MRKNSTKWLAVILFVLTGFAVKAQTFTVTNEADLIAAINSLNTSGVVSGGATVTFTANVSLTAALPTLGSAALNATTTASDPLIIDGAGFSVTANYAGTRTGSLTTGANDALLAIAGTDYVTVQNLTFAEQAGNTTTATMIENAIGIYNLSGTTPFDGVQYLTVNACTFNMNKVTANPLATTIHMTNYVSGGTASLAWATFATDPTQMHRDITISNNTFNGSYNHIIWNNGSSNNGRNLTVSGNTFNNYGGGAGTAYGVYAATRLDGFTVQNNTFSSSTTQSSTNYAVYAATNCGGQQVVTGNTTLLQNAVTTSTSYNIYLSSIGANTQIENNTLNFGTWSAITSGAIYCFYTTNSGGVTGHTAYVRNNHIDNQALPATTGTFYGFYGGGTTTVATNSTVRISQNTFTNNTKSNSGTMYIVYQASAVNTIDSANVISNFTVTNNSASGTSSIYAIYGSNSTPTSAKFLNNTISNINVSGTSTGTTGTIRGIYSFPSGTGTAQEFSGNTVSNLGFLATTTGTVYGIYNATGSTVPINNNVISGLKAVNAGTVYGIYCQGAVTHNVYNNCISDLTAPSGATTTAVTGIYISTGTTVNASYNTIYLSSVSSLTSTATNFGVSGIYQAAAVALNLKNNIINITGTPMGTGTIACVRRSATGTAGTKPANYNPTNNIYYVSAGPQNYIYVEGIAVGTGTLKNGYALSGLTADPTNNIVNDPAFNTGCGLYKLFMLENGTFSEDNLVANGSCFAPTGGSFAESNATTSTTPTITTDLANVTRAATPDMGALEFTGTATDAVAPSITFTNIPNTICTTDAIFSATITDAAGINVTAGTAPRLWFKKSTENNAYNGNTVADNGWKYVEALNTTSPFQFSMSLSLLNSAAAAGDVIQYFVTAQDLAATPNVAVNLAAFPSGFCPLTVALDPAAYPVSGAIKSFTILTDPVNVTSVSSQSTLCVSGTTTLSLSGDASTGAFYQWQSSPAGAGTWSDIAGATTSTYTTASFSTSTDFRCEISCGDLVANGGSPITINNSVPVTVNVVSPTITGTVPASRCGLGSLTLSATGSAGSTVNWYTAATGGSPLTLPYNNIAITGFNNDIVANGVGSSSILGMSNTTVAVDGAGYCFIDNTFKYVSTNALPTCYMPINKQMTSLLTPSLTYQLQDYGTDVANNNNVMTISNTSTTYTNPYSNTGTVTLTTPASYANLKVLYTSVMNVTGMTVDATVTFTDATTQTFTGNSVVNWFTSGANAFTNVGRTTPAGTIQCAAAPYLFELSLPISAGNQAKQVASVNFTIPQVITTGTTPSTVNYFHVFGMGGQNVAVPGQYTTPVISSTTTYYAAASVPGPNVSGGRMTTLTAGSALSGVPRGVQFTANSEGVLNEVGFLCTGIATNVTVQLYNAGGTAAIGSPVTVSIPANAGTSTVPVLMTSAVNIPIPAPGTYRIFATAISGASSLYYEFSGVTGYPYNIGTDYSITGSVTSLTGTLSTTTYYYFYKLGFQSQCSSARVPVDATISAPPTLTVNGAATTECNNAVVTYDVSSPLTDYDSYIWSPLTDLYTDLACTIPYTGTSASTIYLKSATAGTTTHTLNTSNSISGCTNSINVTSTYMPATVSVTGNTDLCLSGTKTLGLSPVTGISASNVQWKMNGVDISGANSMTYTTPNLTTTTTYSADIIDGNGNICLTTANAPVNVNAPVVTGTTPGTRCGLGPVTLAATGTGANGAPTLKWYTAASGGTPIGTGSPFATPSISTTTDFYVSAAEGNGGVSSIPGDGTWDHFTTSGSFQTTTITGAYAILTVLTPITLTSFDMYPSASVGTAFTVEARTGSASGATFATYSGTTTVQNVTTPSVAQTVNTGWTLPAGTYYIGFVSNPNTWRSGAVTHAFPWTLPGVCSLDFYLTPSYQYYLYNLKVTGPCESARQVVTASVTTAPTMTVSPSAAICQGFSTALTSTSSNDPNYEYTWTPGSLVGATQTVSPAATTVYTVNAVDNVTGCATVGTTTITVNQNPTAVSIANTTPAGCPGTAATLTATGGTIGGLYTLGTATTTTAAVGGIPYNSNWEGNHTQYLLTVAELNALGMVGGNINSIAFDVSAVGGGNYVPQSGYTIKLGHTSATALSGYVTPTGSFTTCYGPLALPQPVLGWNTMTFTTPFTWDGVSNIVIDICHDNDPTGTCTPVAPALNCYSASSTVRYTATTGTNTVYGSYGDNAPACGVTSVTTLAANVNRPNMRFNSATPTTLTWLPTTALSTSTGAITVASPLTTTDYTVTATSTDGCTATSSTTVTVLNCSSTLNLTLFLQGYYIGSNTMAEVMANQGYLPSPAVGDCDDITVELHDAVTTTTVAGTTTARLHADGTASASFTPGVTGNYYIVIKHRNSLQTWSTDPVTLATTSSYNFTTAAAQAYADQLVEVEPGVWAIYTGDLNQDDYIDSFDFPIFDLDATNGVSGVYVATDMNGDGYVDPFDFPVFDINSFNGVTAIYP